MGVYNNFHFVCQSLNIYIFHSILALDRHNHFKNHLSFSQNDDVSGNAMRTGFCSTKETDAGNYVQVSIVGKVANVSYSFQNLLF